MPRVSPSDAGIDLKIFGLNVREHRKARGWSIEVLAKRAGVASQTVFRIEHGYPSTEGKRTRLAYALDTVPERLEEAGAVIRNDVAIHSREDDRWMSLIDYRAQVPEDNSLRLQAQEERDRLGGIGFVPQFVKMLRCRLPQGKIVAGVLELYASLPASQYLGGEVFAYALRGNSILHLEGEQYPLSEGQAATIDCAKPFLFSPANVGGSQQLPTLVLYVRLDETEPVSSRRPKRASRVEGQFKLWADPNEGVPVVRKARSSSKKS